MSYKTILLHLNDEKRVAALTNAALRFAHDASAHIVALYVMPAAAPPPGLGGLSSEAWIENQLNAFREQAHRVEAAFGEFVAKRSGLSCEWRLDESAYDEDVASAVIRHARAVDVVVVSQAPQNPWIDDVPQQVGLESGRPVLVVPHEGDFPSFGKDILVAWKASREATRAVYDALPLLRTARSVRIVSLAEAAETRSTDDSSLREIVDALGRQGVTSEPETISRIEQSVGKAILERAEQKHHDLIVMGLYGHSRFREYFLGGASHDVLKDMKIPILFSH